PYWAPLAVGVVVMVVFVLRQLKLQHNDAALLDLRTFASRNFTVSIILMGISMMAMFGMVILLPIYTQNVLHLDVLETGLMMLPGGLLMGLLGPVVGRLYDRVGPTVLVVPGTVLVSAVMWALTLVGQTPPVWQVLVGHV